ncbi:MAG TPA: bifunctional UDP-sugar hydrolase/5'-nucleotidase [Candidatus Solibacter sp.]|jgi:2',3'-cyclic-nucleotide 2'-phosphodiesterase (5'-nucleotidase family)
MFSSIPRRLALLLIACVPLAGEVRSLTILHINDLHARMMPLENKHGGFAYLAALIRSERAGCDDCILLNAGDVAQGTPVSTIFHGLPVFEVANLLGIDVGTLGNHDFDYGWMQARKFMEVAKYPIVSDNIVGAKGELFAAKPYVILKVNGLRVAVIGAMTDDLKTLTIPAAIAPWHTLPVLETAMKYAAELKSQSDLIVLLGHVTPREETAFLQTATNIPVFVTGHLHSGMLEPLTQDRRILVRVKGYAEELGRLELQVDTERKAVVSSKWKHIVVDSTRIKPAADVAAVVKRWEDEVSARVDQPLAVTARAFDKRGVKAVIEQAMREQTGADFAFMNTGGVRDTLPKGQILVRKIWDIMPFDNRVVFGKFKGRNLPAVVVGDRKVDPDREYTLAVTDFTAENQSSPENLRSTGLAFPGDGGLLRDILVDWFRKKKVVE